MHALWCTDLRATEVNNGVYYYLQLSSLYEGKPPISRAKMAQITKSAIKAIKFYKHVVQSVEKFIQKVSCVLFRAV